jgi:hypothetical protein
VQLLDALADLVVQIPSLPPVILIDVRTPEGPPDVLLGG